MADPVAGDTVTLDIRGIAAGGAGLGNLPDGRVAFVHRTAPGDRVEARITKVRPRWARAEVTAVLEGGAARVKAPCRHYDACGGCTLQHLAYEEQLVWKARFVTDALARIGGLEVPPVEVSPSPKRTEYRNRVTFTVRQLAAGRIVAGFHARSKPGRVVDISRGCLLPDPLIQDAWEALRASWKGGARPLPRGRELRVTLRVMDEGGIVVLVKGGADGWDPEALLSTVPGVVGVWHHPGGAPAPVRLSGDVVYEVWGDDRVPVAGHAFLQVNREAGAELSEYVLDHVGEPGRAVDAYCGVGRYGRALARSGWEVTGIELDGDAVAGARHDAPGGFTVLAGEVERHLASVLPADLVVLNPPRAGLHESVPGMLLQEPPSTVIYVSCDPATLARDTGHLKAGYSLEALRAFDLFPQTAHVESVAVFRRAQG